MSGIEDKTIVPRVKSLSCSLINASLFFFTKLLDQA